MATRIKTPIILGLLALAIFLMPGCNGVGDDLVIPCTNPCDLDCEFPEPIATIDSGPDEEATVATHTVSFSWHGDNEDIVSYAYSLSESIWFDTTTTTDTTVTFEYLAEGRHRFEVKAQYCPDVEGPPVSREFIIDAVPGPAIRLDERSYSVALGDTFVAEVFLEEVDSLKGVLALLGFSPDSLAYVRGEIYTDHQSILMETAGGQVISKFTPDAAGGTVKMEAATTTGDPPYVSGTGPIGQITFQAVQAGITRLRFLELTELRNVDNERIENVEKVPSLIEIRP